MDEAPSFRVYAFNPGDHKPDVDDRDWLVAGFEEYNDHFTFRPQQISEGVLRLSAEDFLGDENGSCEPTSCC